MKNPFSSKDLTEPTRRRVELSIAVAQERLLSTHVEHVLRLIQLVGEQVPFENALAIYTRMLRLSDDEARVITTRALATLGEKVAGGREVWPELTTPDEEPPREKGGEKNRSGKSVFNLMRQRLRGRVNDDMRRWVELSAARTEVAILHTHVENALSFVDLLEKEMANIEAVELYLDALEVRDSIAEVTAYMALAQLADRHLPESKSAIGRAASEAVHDAEAESPRLAVDRNSR